MAEHEGDRKAAPPIRKRLESLGWLTESTIMPKKQKSIEGVGPSSILELNAQLYKSQEEAKRLPKEPHRLQVHRAKHKVSAHDAYSASNSGVASRAQKDKLEMKAVKDGAASYAALEKKAELYEKLMRGEISDEEENEKYCVDFFRKGVEMEETQQPQGHDTSNAKSQDEDGSFMPDTKPSMLGRMSGSIDRNEHKRLVKEVHEEASQAREKASELKQRREEQVAARREKLKQAYLRKQLEKLKSSSKADQT
ncbi:hypothetical protein LIER_03734 [Lithospermum erythrorhizon]|uniref:Uncharacterized protein n=1 Tax=Lithospermum erythrorhizon TaxID=34254 RepID=A0AAV3NU77_LITER